jgi:hypothetical protein
MRRLEYASVPKRKAVLAKAEPLPKKADEAMRKLMLGQAAAKGTIFFKTSKFVRQPTGGGQGQRLRLAALRLGPEQGGTVVIRKTRLTPSRSEAKEGKGMISSSLCVLAPWREAIMPLE